MTEKSQREEWILDRVASGNHVLVSDLSKDLGVSEVTIRSDLSELEQRGVLTRIRGGAAPSSYRTIMERERENTDQKIRIGRAAAALVRDHDSLMVEGGTTTVTVASFLEGKQGVQVVSNSTLMIPPSRLNPNFRLVMSGGLLHHPSQSMVGADAIAGIRRFNARLAFVGTDGLTVDRGLTTTFSEGAEVIRAMSQQAEETWLLADSSKFGKIGFVAVLPLSDLSGVVTDAGISEEVISEFRSRGVRVVVAY